MPLSAQLAKLLAASLSKQTKGAQDLMSFPTGSVMKHEPTMRVLTPEQEAESFAPIGPSSYDTPLTPVETPVDVDIPAPLQVQTDVPAGSDSPSLPSQDITSKTTSRKQIPALFKNKLFDEPSGSRNLDLGGGGYDLGSDWLKENKGIENFVVDKYWKTEEQNTNILKQFKNNPADSVTINNVLNVIKEEEVRNTLIQDSFKYLKPNRKAYFQIYEGEGTDIGSGIGRETRDGWQNYKKTEGYVKEIEEVYGRGNVKRKGKVLIATKPFKKKGKTRKEIEIQGGPLSGKVNEQEIGRILDEHNIEWEYNDNGGITAIEEFSKGPSRKKSFKRNTSLKTVRDWLGYAKGGVVDMRDGGKVGAAVVAASLMASGGQATLDDFTTPSQFAERQKKIDQRTEVAKKAGFKNFSEYYKSDYTKRLGKARDANTSYWKKYGPMGNFQSKQKEGGLKETEFMLPPGYNLSDETITEQNKLIENAYKLRNQKLKDDNESEGYSSINKKYLDNLKAKEDEEYERTGKRTGQVSLTQLNRDSEKQKAQIAQDSVVAFSKGGVVDMRNGGVVGMEHGGPVIDYVTPEEKEFDPEVSKQMDALLAKRYAEEKQAAVDYGGFEQPSPMPNTVPPIPKMNPLRIKERVMASTLKEIADAEGTEDQGYNIVFGTPRGGSSSRFINPTDANNKPINLTSMTLKELDKFQRKLINATRDKVKGVKLGYGTSAVGKYQVTRPTLELARTKLRYSRKDWNKLKYTPELQEQIGRVLLEHRGLDKMLKGKITPEQYRIILSNEWASIPGKIKKEGGQPTPANVGRIEGAFSKAINELKVGSDPIIN